MNTVMVTGRFVDETGRPLDGECKFLPSRLWVDEEGESYPTQAPEVSLVNGKVLAYLNRTDQEELPWYYTVVCPAGTLRIEVKEDGPLKLRDLFVHNA